MDLTVKKVTGYNPAKYALKTRHNFYYLKFSTWATYYNFPLAPLFARPTIGYKKINILKN